MATQATTKFNLPKTTTYIIMPRAFLGKDKRFKDLTDAYQYLLAEIYTMNKAFKAPAKLTYEHFVQKFGMSKETVSAGLNTLKELGIIERLGNSRYQILLKFNTKDYIIIDDYLHKQQWDIAGVQKRLARSRITALGFLSRSCSNPKTGGVFISSQARIGVALNLPKSTAGDTVRELAAAKLCKYEKAPDSYGASKRGLYKYTVAPKILNVKRKKPELKQATAAPEPKQPKPQNDGQELRAQIERHYYSLRHRAEERAERALAAATNDKEYGALRKRLNNLAFEIPLTEIREPAKAAKLTEEQLELEAKADKRLLALGIDKAELTPHYQCSVCNDTGYDSGGNPCKCLKQFIKTLNKA